MTMAGSEQKLDVFLGTYKVAHLSLYDDELYWEYTKEWQQYGYALSPHMPLHTDISTKNTKRFLRNMLPEGNAFEELLTYHHLSRNNTFGLMRSLGLDIPGALVMIPASLMPPKQGTFIYIQKSDLAERLQKHSSLIIWNNKPRLSVAGVQDKINVVVNTKGSLGFGEGSLCSTHILKFSDPRTPHLVLNEYVSMQLAKRIGLEVADVSITKVGNFQALLIRRFDRKMLSARSVMRKHMIDGCQALNLPPEYKYERNLGDGRDVAHIREGASLKKILEFADKCINPALTKKQIFSWIIFNVLIYNFDAHGKNISFFVSKNGIQLAPFYDLVNIGMYPEFQQNMAMAIGDEFNANKLHSYQFADFADLCNIPRALIIETIERVTENIMLELPKITKEIYLTTDENRFIEEYIRLVISRCRKINTEVQQIQAVIV